MVLDWLVKELGKAYYFSLIEESEALDLKNALALKKSRDLLWAASTRFSSSREMKSEEKEHHAGL